MSTALVLVAISSTINIALQAAILRALRKMKRSVVGIEWDAFRVAKQFTPTLKSSTKP